MPANPTISTLRPQLTLTGPGGELPLDRPTIEALAELFVALLNITEPDTDLEVDDPAEHDGTELDAAWPDWDQERQSRRCNANAASSNEDDEDDSEDCDGFENEPAIDAKTLQRLRARYGDGPGGGVLLDSDLGGDGT